MKTSMLNLNFTNLNYMFCFVLFCFYKFIYLFWLCWVFVAARGLSLVAASRGYSSLPCKGFSLQGLLIEVASLVAEHGF